MISFGILVATIIMAAK
ncbi:MULTISPECIES: hypothetical protein [Veillonella]